MKQDIKFRILAVAISVFLIFTFMSALLFFQQIEIDAPETMIIRQIALAPPPPPPPPPSPVQERQADSTPVINLSTVGAGPTMKFSQIKVINKAQLSDLTPPDLTPVNTAFSDQLTVDWQAFGLNELDDVPRLLTSLKINFPKSLVRKGIRKITVELDVLIDENGKVVLRNIISNPYPEFEPIIQNLMQKARFTAPKKAGISVRAVFNWPLEFSHS